MFKLKLTVSPLITSLATLLNPNVLNQVYCIAAEPSLATLLNPNILNQVYCIAAVPHSGHFTKP
jgi:hypothetical protein